MSFHSNKKHKGNALHFLELIFFLKEMSANNKDTASTKSWDASEVPQTQVE